jgi:Fe-S cluster biogenesis protein NfuA
MISIESVEKAIDNIRPYLMADGGNIKVLEITEDQVVKVELLGSCGDCRMSSMTLKAGVEDAIRQAFPEIKRVEAVNIFSETV